MERSIPTLSGWVAFALRSWMRTKCDDDDDDCCVCIEKMFSFLPLFFFLRFTNVCCVCYVQLIEPMLNSWFNVLYCCFWYDMYERSHYHRPIKLLLSSISLSDQHWNTTPDIRHKAKRNSIDFDFDSLQAACCQSSQWSSCLLSIRTKREAAAAAACTEVSQYKWNEIALLPTDLKR